MQFKETYVKKESDGFQYLFARPREEENVDIPFEEFLTQYDSWRSYYVRYGTRVYDRTVINNYLLNDNLTTVKEVLGPYNVRRAYTKILQRNAKVMWKNRAFGVIRKMVETAYKWSLLTLEEKTKATALIDNLPENRRKRAEKKMLTHEEVMKFFSVIEDDDDKVLFLVALTLGARISELLGLTWDVYDSEGGYIEIKQQVLNVGNHTEELVDDLKTNHSYRTCKIPKIVQEYLNEYKARSSGKGFIFKSVANPGHNMSKSSVRARLKKYCDLAGVPEITMHSFRHMKATEFMKVCNDMQEIKAAAAYLGHSATMLIETYGHASSKTTEEILGRLDDLKGVID